MNFDEAFDKLIGHEGGYSNHPSDPGGETMWGVTKRVAQANGYSGAMRDLPKDVAKSIYRKLYWDAAKIDQLPVGVRFDVFDGAVNSGVGQSIKWLQRASRIDERDIDGVPGPKTISATRYHEAGLSARYNGIRLKFMTDLGTWSTFGRGWARRIAENLMSAS